MRLVPYLGLSILTLFARTARAQAPADDEPVANPGRPTIATPATLTPVGYLQFETGVLGASHSPEFSHRESLNEVIKFSVARRLELLASGEPLVHYSGGGPTGSSYGDLSLGAQALLVQGEGSKPSLAASYLHHIHDSGGAGLDFGSPSNSFLFLASADVKGFHYDANALFNELVNGSTRRFQLGQTLSVSHTLAGPFSLTGEIWHFTQPFLHGHAVGSLWALGYTPRKTLVFDAGFNRGLTGTSTRWEVFAGFTYLLPHRLF